MRWTILLVSLLFLLAACGTTPPTPASVVTTPATQNMTGATQNVTGPNGSSSLCPEPVVCPVPTPCPACDVTPSSAEGGLAELGLKDVQLSTKERGDDTDVTVLKLTQKEIDTITSATLLLTPTCSDPGRLIVELKGDELFSGTPACNTTTSVNVDPTEFSLRNTFTFTTEGEEDYAMAIALNLTFLNGSTEDRPLYGVSFSPSRTQQELFKRLDPVTVKNYEDRTLTLTAAEAQQDFTLTFEGADRDGTLVILVNDKEVFRGKVQRHANEITVPHELLREGENYLTFVGE